MGLMNQDKKMDISELLVLSVKNNASDLHISPGQPPVLRINGDLSPIEGFPVLEPEVTKSFLYSFFNAKQKEEFEKQWELDFAIELPKISRFRVNVFRQAN